MSVVGESVPIPILDPAPVKWISLLPVMIPTDILGVPVKPLELVAVPVKSPTNVVAVTIPLLIVTAVPTLIVVNVETPVLGAFIFAVIISGNLASSIDPLKSDDLTVPINPPSAVIVPLAFRFPSLTRDIPLVLFGSPPTTKS